MNRLVPFLCVVGLSFGVLGGEVDSGTVNTPSWFKRVFCRLTWEEIQHSVRTPKEASCAIRRNVRYQEELGDTWASGQATWERGLGDCEDMAAAVVELVRGFGGDARILIFHPTNSLVGHAVAMGTWKGRSWISSNGFYQEVDSMDEAKIFVAKEMAWRHQVLVVEEIGTAPDIQVAATSPIFTPPMASVQKPVLLP